jgi:hypothetical protein
MTVNKTINIDDIDIQTLLATFTEQSLQDPDLPKIRLITATQPMLWELIKFKGYIVTSVGPYNKYDYKNVRAQFQEKMIAFLITENTMIEDIYYEAWVVEPPLRKENS